MSNTRDTLENMFNGKQPIRRQNPKLGESQWYYMMPRDPNNPHTEYEFIDVPNQNTPNPLLQNNLASIHNQPKQNVPTIQNTTLTNGLYQGFNSLKDMASEYFKMKNHGYKFLDDYHHCKANYNATTRGTIGEAMAETLRNLKENYFDYYHNVLYKGLSQHEAEQDKQHDLSINQIGRERAKSGKWSSAKDACADFRAKNRDFPERFW